MVVFKFKKRKKKRGKNNNNNNSNNNENENDRDRNQNKSKLTGKQLRKKNAKFKKKQIKKLESLGLSQLEIDKKIKEIMDKRKNEINTENEEEDLDVNVFEINDLLERPRIASVPKQTLNYFTSKSEDIDLDLDSDDETQSSINQPTYNFNIMEYSKTLQNYIKEKNRILPLAACDFLGHANNLHIGQCNNLVFHFFCLFVLLVDDVLWSMV